MFHTRKYEILVIFDHLWPLNSSNKDQFECWRVDLSIKNTFMTRAVIFISCPKKKLIEVFFKYICTLPRPPQPKISVLENSHEYKKWSAHRVQRPCVFGFSSTSNFFSKVLERSCGTTQLLRILFGENKIPGGGAIL